MNKIILLFGILCLLGPPNFIDKSPKDGLWEALEYYDIHHKEIVYAQAIHETGNFTSNLCCKHNNLFGLKRTNTRYYHFNHWSESVKAYKEKIQNRYRDGEDYYMFLKRINYASDPKYNQRIKLIVKQQLWK